MNIKSFSIKFLCNGYVTITLFDLLNTMYINCISNYSYVTNEENTTSTFSISTP